MRSSDFILGYTLPMIPLTVLEGLATYIFAITLGLEINLNIIYAIIMILPIGLLYVSIGLLCGSIFNDKQVGGICGALLTNLSAWLSGIWFDLDLVGGAFKRIANLLPFVHAVELQRLVINGDISQSISHILWVLSYAVIISLVAVFTFLKQMKKG